jgi:hypothetical protein
MAFWIPWTIDAIAAAIALFFFLWGIADGTVSSFNIATWLILLAALGAVVGGSLWLRKSGKRGPAILLAWVLAAPALLMFAFFALIVILKPDFR